MGKIVEGTLAAVAPVALAPRSVVVRPPGIDVLTLAPGSLGHSRTGGLPTSGAIPTAQLQSTVASDRAILEGATATRHP